MLDAETHINFASCSELVLRRRHLNDLNLMSTLKLPLNFMSCLKIKAVIFASQAPIGFRPSELLMQWQLNFRGCDLGRPGVQKHPTHSCAQKGGPAVQLCSVLSG